MKNKLSTETKVKLIYCGELAIISIVVLVIGILKMVDVIHTRPTRLFIYNIITTVGAAYFIFDLVWYIVSPKKRKRSSLLDKLLILPASFYLIYFDIICFIDKYKNAEPNELFVRYSVGAVLLYIAVIYLFQAFFHFKYPVPQLIEAIEEAKQAELEEKKEKNENKVEEQQTEEVEEKKED